MFQIDTKCSKIDKNVVFLIRYFRTCADIKNLKENRTFEARCIFWCRVFLMNIWGGWIGSAMPAPHSLALKLRAACFRLLIVEPDQLCWYDIKPKTHDRQNKKRTRTVHFLFWWESACTNRAENKQEFTDLIQLVKEFKEKWLN